MTANRKQTVYYGLPDTRAPAAMVQSVEARLCTFCDATLQRLAYRQYIGNSDSRWVAFGWRCSRCNTIFVEGGR
jgi:hypothetical protein